MALQWGVIPATKKVFPGTIPEGDKQVSLFGCRGEVVSFQVMLRSSQRVTLPVQSDDFDLFEALYVPTPRVASWGFSRPEHTQPCYPDPLLPATKIELSPNETKALWARIRLVESKQSYVKISDITIPVVLTVYPIEIPITYRTAIGIGGAGFARQYNTTVESEDYWRIYEKYYLALLDYRLNAFTPPFGAMDSRAKKYINDPRVNTFRAPFYSGNKDQMRQMWQQLGAARSKVFFDCLGEPVTAEEYQTGAGQMKYLSEVCPEAKYIVTFFQTAPNLVTPFDYMKGALWCPQTDCYTTIAKVQQQAQERVAQGDELLFYTALAPRGEYCNILLNHTALEHRLLFWCIYATGIASGYLYWHSTYWDLISDPWKQQETLGPNYSGVWGDGSLFYPLPDGPCGSIRLEMIRAGLQDIELLRLLEAKKGKAAAIQVCKQAAQGFTQYIRDPKRFEEIRVLLLKELAGDPIPIPDDENEQSEVDNEMSVQIIQDFIPVGRRNRPGYKMDPRWITIHDTANTQAGAGAAAHASYLKNQKNLEASWHFTVDDKVIYQHLPLNENGWHAGDGASGTGNRQSIGIEICENRDGNRVKAEANAAWLTAKLLKDYGLGLDRVKQHYDWSGKNCPRVLRGRKGGWQGFLAAVEAHLKPAPKLPAITRTIGIYVGGKKVDEVGYLINNATYVRAAYVIGLAGGQVTGHGDHIRIVVEKK